MINEWTDQVFGTPEIFFYNIIYFNLTSQYYKLMKSFLSLLSERREMRASEKMPAWVWVWDRTQVLSHRRRVC
jgi:hypothetical protein